MKSHVNIMDSDIAYENVIVYHGSDHILKEPISQFFRKVIAEDQGNIEKYNYKTNPDTTLTLKTIKNLQTFF